MHGILWCFLGSSGRSGHSWAPLALSSDLVKTIQIWILLLLIPLGSLLLLPGVTCQINPEHPSPCLVSCFRRNSLYNNCAHVSPNICWVPTECQNWATQEERAQGALPARTLNLGHNDRERFGLAKHQSPTPICALPCEIKFQQKNPAKSA